MLLRTNTSKSGPAASDRSPLASGGKAAARRAGDGLSLAAAPTFAAMALLTAASGNGDMICSAMPGMSPSPLTGMVPMYLLMSAFHLAPWLRLVSRQEVSLGR